MRPPVVPTFTPPPRRRSFSGLTGSALFHAVLLFLLLSPYFRRYHLLSATGSDLPGTGGGGGAGAQYIALPALREFAAKPPAPVVEVHVTETPPVTPPVVPPTVIPPPTPADTTPSHPATPPSDSAGGASGGGPGTGGGSGGGNGGGQGPGTGGGAGPGTGGGERGRPPEMRTMVVPPTEGTPKQLRGRVVTVRFFVNIDGGVDRIEFEPEIPSGNFRNSFVDLMKGYRFKPARDSLGAAVPGVALVTLNLSTH